MSVSHAPRTPRLKPLVLAVLGTFTVANGLASPFAIDTTASPRPMTDSAAPEGTETWIVENCNDKGPGSLRWVIDTQAGSGDTIDLSGLTCSTITLETGVIHVPQDEIFLVGPSADQLAIDGNDRSPVFEHGGSSSFLINGLTVRNGRNEPAAGHVRGGCIASNGTVFLMNAAVRDCTARVDGDRNAMGGGVYAAAGLYLDGTSITGNRALSDGPANLSGFGVGGGVFSMGRAEFNRTTIAGNTARGADNGFKGQSGGAWVFGGGAARNTTIANNIAGSNGGLLMMDALYGDPIDIVSSTISGNVAGESVIGAGLYVGMTSQLTVINSTITLNIERNAKNMPYGAGLLLGSGDVPTHIANSIIAGNLLDDGSGGLSSDIGSGGSTAAVSGSHNLIGYSPLQLPADTISDEPMLEALADNGGPTWTHALPADSPAVDAGDDNGHEYDQRGEGFPRIVGKAADIGAYELKAHGTGDEIFLDGFELCAGCPSH
ncbi:MAG: hypothetical protein NVV68_03685 [Dokdonella sp.]|nr:hypothetical protein [Dokdonella sp.]